MVIVPCFLIIGIAINFILVGEKAVISVAGAFLQMMINVCVGKVYGNLQS